MKKYIIALVAIGIIISGIGVYYWNRYIFQIVHFSSGTGLLRTGDIILIDDRAYINKEPAINDLIIFNNLKTPYIQCIAQIIGGPGNSIINYETGWFSLKEIKFYISQMNFPLIWISKTQPIFELGDNQYFVLGDIETHDSRVLGPVERKDIVGKVIIPPWPLTKKR